MAPAPASLLVHDLTKRYGQNEAVRGVSFGVAPGEIFGLLGPNGAGKTSIIEMILGLRDVDSGTISVSGIDARAHPLAARRLLGAQLQFASLQDKITPRQALECFGAFYANALPVEQLLEQFSLVNKSTAPFDSLSGGQKQRLFLALALINQPQVLVLDEPTAGLDPQARRELHGFIRQLKTEGRSVILSTHHLDEAHQLCDRLAVLHEGRIIATGTPDELIAQAKTRPRLVFSTRKPLESREVESLPHISSHAVRGDGWQVQTSDVNRTVSVLVQRLEAHGNEMLDLQIQRPSLEDVFLDLTGREWSQAQKESRPT